MPYFISALICAHLIVASSLSEWVDCMSERSKLLSLDSEVEVQWLLNYFYYNRTEADKGQLFQKKINGLLWMIKFGSRS